MSDPALLPPDTHHTSTVVAAPVSERPQCWECQRRRLVCDGTRPVCNKCRSARIVCPGYTEKKPLTWLAPGRVTSRTHTRKRKNETIVHRPKIVSNDEQKASASTSALSIRATSKQSTTNRQDSFAITIPVELRPEVYDLFEAMMYYNDHIYPDLVQHQLGPTGFIIPVANIQNVPATVVHTVVTVVLNHRIIQMAENPATNALVKPLWARMYRHLDVAIRTINKLMSEEKTRTHLLTLISVYTLLFAMVQQSFTPCWRPHIEGFMSLMQAFGSFSDVIRDIPDMEPSLMAVCIVSILANTTSPRNQQIQIGTAAETLFLIRTYFTETYYPTVSFPPELFTTIIHINNLRALSPSAETTLAALSLLSDLATFSPSSWSSTRPNHHSDWLLLSQIFHSSTTLYALLSLQSSSALPSPNSSSPPYLPTLFINFCRTRSPPHASRLQSLLPPRNSHGHAQSAQAHDLATSGGWG